jgi:hypothetical protein
VLAGALHDQPVRHTFVAGAVVAAHG